MMSLLVQFVSEMQQDERLFLLTLTADCERPQLLRLVPTVSPWNLVPSTTFKRDEHGWSPGLSKTPLNRLW